MIKNRRDKKKIRKNMFKKIHGFVDVPQHKSAEGQKSR